MRQRRRFVLLGAFTTLVAGCTSSGRDFTRPQTSALVLGQTTIDDAITSFGEPTQRLEEAADPALTDSFDERQPRPAPLRRASLKGEFERLLYSFSHTKMVMLSDQAVARIRQLDLTFWKGKLVAYNYSSSFAEDSTNFDEAKVAAFVRNRTTTTDVLNQLGTPGGQAVYPYVARQGTRAYFYQYAMAGPRKGQVTLKHLELLFTPVDRLEQVYLVTDIKDGSA
jgi:hypothetical protein